MVDWIVGERYMKKRARYWAKYSVFVTLFPTLKMLVSRVNVLMLSFSFLYQLHSNSNLSKQQILYLSS